MSNKFVLSHSLDSLTNESFFDKLIKEINPGEIPAKYIHWMTVVYINGETVNLTGKEISHPIPLNKNASLKELETSFKKVKNIKVFINTRKLEYDVNRKIKHLLDNKLL